MINNKVELVMNGSRTGGLPWGTTQYRITSYNDARYYLLRYDDSQATSVCRKVATLGHASYNGCGWRLIIDAKEKMIIIIMIIIKCFLL